MTGHIGLGAPGDEREYLLRDPKGFDRSAANPFAARVNTNEQYGDLEGWSEEVWENWQTGITREPDEGGTWYSETETRFRNRIFLRSALEVSGLAGRGATTTESLLKPYLSAPAYPELESILPVTGEINLNTTTLEWATDDYHLVERMSLGLLNLSTWSFGTINGVWVKLKSVDGTNATITLKTSDNPDPDDATGTSIGTGSLATSNGRPGYHWFYIPLDTPYTGTPPEIYIWVTIEATTPGEDLYIPYTGKLIIGGSDLWYSGTDDTWKSTGHYYWDLLVDCTAHQMGSPGTDVNVDNIIEFNSLAYAASYTQLYEWDSANIYPTIWNAKGAARSTSITSLAVWDGDLWIGLGDSTNLDTMNTSGTYSAGSVPARLLYRHMGYLYRAVQNDLYYSSDGTTWTGPLECGSDDFAITGIAAAGENVYVSTPEGLYLIAPGDFPTGIHRWDTLDSRNGVGMTTGEDGSLYIPLVRQLLRLDPYGSMNDIWFGYTEGLPADIIGDIKTIISVYGQVWALVDPPTNTTSPSTVWAFNGQGWHNVAVLPDNMAASSVAIDYTSKRVLIGTENGYVHIVHIPTYGINPLNDPASTYEPSTWFEQSKFYGGWMDLYKDFESVFITGDNISSSYPVQVYWQDEASTGWELLGTITSDMQELRWDDYTVRPASRWIKLGFLLSSVDSANTPVIEAIRLKFHVNVNDRFSWPMDIIVSDEQAMIDGTKNTQTAAQMLAHLDSLSSQTPPVIFRDTDGVRYECKVTTHRRRILEYDWKTQDGEPRVTYVYSLVLDQVNTDVYTP